MSKNDKWEMFKNFMHNELEISKEDIRTWIQEAVENEAKRLVAREFNDFSVKKEVSKVLEYHTYNDKNLKVEVLKEAGRILAERLEVEVKK